LRNDDGTTLIENYLSEVSSNLPNRVAREVIPELRSHLIEEATADNELSAQSARRAVSRMGEPKTIAEEYSREYKAGPREDELGKDGGAAHFRTENGAGRRCNYSHNYRYHDHVSRCIGAPMRAIGGLVKWTGSLIVKLILLGLLIGAVVSLVVSITTLLLPFPYYKPYTVIGGLASSLTLFIIYYVLKVSIYGKPKFSGVTSKSYQGQRVETKGLSSEPVTSGESERDVAIAFPADGKTRAPSHHQNSGVVAEERWSQATKSPAVNYCPYCGEALKSDASFCPNCGASVREEDNSNVSNNTANS
jgi:hypothetical protein